MTTGEGGMVDDRATRPRRRGCVCSGPTAWIPTAATGIPVIGYNYRMTNIAAAIGLAQLERVQWQLDRRQELAAWYREELAGREVCCTLQGRGTWCRHVWWMFSVLVNESAADRDGSWTPCVGRGIETRPFVHPLHTLPPYLDRPGGPRVSGRRRRSPAAASIFRRGPADPRPGAAVCDSLLECLTVGEDA